MVIGGQNGTVGTEVSYPKRQFPSQYCHQQYNTCKVGDGSPRHVVYHEQVTDSMQCSQENECSIANQEGESIEISFSADISPLVWIAAGFGVAKSWSVGVSHECNGGPDETVCLWVRTPYIEYEVQNCGVDSCYGRPELEGESFRIKSPNKDEELRPYCVVGAQYCRKMGSRYWQFDGLEEYPYWYPKGK
ncbi:hypothetical protein SLS54_007182 [Diplodia seriata]